MTKRCNAKDLKPGDVWSRHSFGRVTGMGLGGLQVRNTAGLEWTIDRKILEQEFSIAGQEETTTKVNRTQVIQILSENSHTAMTVTFRKKPDPKIVAADLAEGRRGASEAAWRKQVAAAMRGKERVMVGWHVNQYDDHKRLKFREMAGDAAQPRLIDPRTIDSIIVNQIKYEVKK